MKRSFTVLLCLILSCLFLLSACNKAGESAGNAGGPQEESRGEETSDVHDDGAQKPRYETLSALYPWIGSLQEGDILKVRMEIAAIGVAPGHLREIAYSTDRDDIKNVYEEVLLSSLKEISASEGEIEGGGYVRYDLYAKDDSYSLIISNQTVYVNGIYYQFERELCKLNSASMKCYAFITYADMTDKWDTFAVFTCGPESVKLGEFQGLGVFEFTEYTGECDMNAKLRLISDTVELSILSENLFMIEGDDDFRVFQITVGKDFSEFLKLSSEKV